MNISKKIIACSAVCAALGIGVTAFAAQNTVNSSILNSAPAAEAAKTDEQKPSEIIDTVSSEENSAHNEKEVVVKALSAEEWAEQPHALPSKFAPENLDFVNTTNGYPGSCNTTIYADSGSDVYAVDSGEIIFADYNNVWNNGYGSAVVIKHGDGLYTIYSGLLPVDKGGKAFVSAGDEVKAGQLIGLAGSSGSIRDYGVGYGFYTKLPKFFADKIS